MSKIVDESTDAQALVGGVFSTEYFGPFEVLGADQAPELTAMVYMAKDLRDGQLFFAFLPWGKELIES